MGSKDLRDIGCLLALVLSNPAFSGSNSSGGGHSVNNTLLDLWENEGTVKFDPMKIDSVRETLASIETLVPAFANKLKTSLRKMWYLEPKSLTDCKGGDSMLKADLRTVACQNSLEVRISAEFFNSDAQGAAKKALRQKSIVLHEMLRNLRLENMGTEEGMRLLVRELSAELPAEDKLADLVAACGFGRYRTATTVARQLKQVDEAQEFLMELRKEAELVRGVKDTEATDIAKVRAPITAKWIDFNRDIEAYKQEMESGKISRRNYEKKMNARRDQLTIDVSGLEKEFEAYKAQRTKQSAVSFSALNEKIVRAKARIKELEIKDIWELKRYADTLFDTLEISLQYENTSLLGQPKADQSLQKAMDEVRSQIRS